MKLLKADLHLHSNFSDGKLSIGELVDYHGQRGFDVIAITDHITEKNNFIGRVTRSLNLSLCEKSFSSYLKEYQFQKLRALEQYQMNLIFGYEITKNSFLNNRSCHLLILGVEQLISPDLEVEEILYRTQELGGIAIAAHPFQTGEFEFQSFYLWSRKEKLDTLIDAWEVSCRKKICPEILNSGLPLIASSDLHHLGHFNSWKSWLMCQNDFLSIKKCLKNRRVDFFLDQLNPTELC